MKNKRIIVPVLVFLCVIGTVGCSFSQKANIPKLEDVKNEALDFANDNLAKEEAPEEIDIKMKGTCYHYDQLNDDEKRVYQYLYQGCKEYAPEIKIESVNGTSFERALYAFRADHPEFFWAQDEVTFMTNSREMVEKVLLKVPTDAKEKKKLLQNTADEILEGAPKGKYKKVKYIYEYIINNTDYDLYASDNQSVYSVLINKASVCGGYSRTFLYLCDRAGIECGYVAGEILCKDTHAWNFVKIDGQYYWVDATWGDPSYGNYTNDSETILYDYLCVTDDEILPGRVMSNDPSFSGYETAEVFEYPSCTDGSLNYFVRHGIYFETYDRNAVSDAILSEAEDPDKKMVVIKFANDEAMDQATEDLFDNGYFWTETARALSDRYGINDLSGKVYMLNELNHLVINIR